MKTIDLASGGFQTPMGGTLDNRRKPKMEELSPPSVEDYGLPKNTYPRPLGGAVPMPKQSQLGRAKLEQVGGDENVDCLSQSTSEIINTQKSASRKSVIRYLSQERNTSEPEDSTPTSVQVPQDSGKTNSLSEKRKSFYKKFLNVPKSGALSEPSPYVEAEPPRYQEPPPEEELSPRPGPALKVEDVPSEEEERTRAPIPKPIVQIELTPAKPAQLESRESEPKQPSSSGKVVAYETPNQPLKEPKESSGSKQSLKVDVSAKL